MTTSRKIGIAIVLVCALVAAAGMISGYLSREIGVGLAVIGIVIGTGVARGTFSNAADGRNRN